VIRGAQLGVILEEQARGMLGAAGKTKNSNQLIAINNRSNPTACTEWGKGDEQEHSKAV